MGDNTKISDGAIGEAVTSILKGFDDELFALTTDQLVERWYFQWDDKASVAWNVYQFSEMLGMFKGFCRRWETHHNGSVCVVERVRDKYLMPKIKAFIAEMAARVSGGGKG